MNPIQSLARNSGGNPERKKEGQGKNRTEEKDQELTCVGIKPNGILCSSAACEAERDAAASGDWQELGENGMRRGSADHGPNDQENSELGKKFQTPGGGLLNKRRERQRCAINFVCTSLPLSLSLFVFTIRPLEVHETGSLDCLNHKLLGRFTVQKFAGFQVCWRSVLRFC